MSAPVEVCAAVVVDGDRLLVARRARPAELAGLWEFPGGKLESGESPAQCLEREMIEELALPIVVGEAIGASTQAAERRGGRERPALRLTAYAAHLRPGPVREPRLVDGTHDRVAWVSAAELRDLRLAPLDVPLQDAAMALLAPSRQDR